LAVGCLLAHQSAFGLLAVSRAVALPVTEWLFADRFASRGGVGALGVARRLLADRVAFWAGSLFAVFDRAAHLALGLVTLDLTLGAAQLLAARGAARLLADRLADLIADRGRALPLAFGVAVLAVAALARGIVTCDGLGLQLVGEEVGVGADGDDRDE